MVSSGNAVEEGSSASMGAALDALLGAGAACEGAGGGDAEEWVARLTERVARLEAANVGGMLAGAGAGGAGAALAARLEAGAASGEALRARLQRCESLARGAPDASHASSGAARHDHNARRLLQDLTQIYAWLDPPPLKDLDSLSEICLTTSSGRAAALEAASALRMALRGEAAANAAWRRLGAVRERLRRLQRARDSLAQALARHLNNLLIHLGNEAAPPAPAPRHHAELLPYAPFMRWLKDMDEKAFEGLVRVYTGTWARVYERAVRAAVEAARSALPHAPPQGVDPLLDQVLSLVESLCNAEQDFCTQFFHLDVDIKSDGSDGEKSERSEGGESTVRRAGAGEARRVMGELFPGLEAELGALVGQLEGLAALAALACVGRRALGGDGSGGGGEARWARAALAHAAVAAKRAADRAVAERVAALPDAVRAAARRPKCGVLPSLHDFEELTTACEQIFAGGRRADLDRWYVALAQALLAHVAAAEHPRTPRAVVQLENYHRLHAQLAALRVPALEALRRECRARYAEALRTYVTQYFGRPLEKLTQFFEGVSEAVGLGAREEEVCFRAAFSKHEVRRLLALYPAAEVRRALHRLYRTVDKHLSEEAHLLQVVWRAMQEEFIAQHVQLQARLAACYPGSGLALPLSTEDILQAFSDIARQH